MDLSFEFTTQNDEPTVIATHDQKVGVGFRTGFVRVFEEGKMVSEMMVYESKVMDMRYGGEDGRWLAVFYRNSKIVVFKTDKGY